MKSPRRNAAAPPLARPLVIASLNQKGGVGKSTVAAAVGDEALCRGLRVLFLDADPQHTLMDWARAAGEQHRRAPRVLDVAEPHTKAGEFAGHDVVIIDCPGRLDVALRSALMVADVALVPCLPSMIDLWALKDTVKLVREGQRLRPGLQLQLVLNCMTRTRLARGTAATIRGAVRAGEHVLQAELYRRSTYGEALAAGAGPTSYAPTSDAAFEVQALFDEIFETAAAEGRAPWPAASHATASR